MIQLSGLQLWERDQALVLLDKDSPVRAIGYLTPLVAPLMIVVTALLWRKAIDRYQGVGH